MRRVLRIRVIINGHNFVNTGSFILGLFEAFVNSCRLNDRDLGHFVLQMLILK